MDSINKLPVTPRIFHDETMEGYIARLAEANDFPNVDYLYSHLNYKPWKDSSIYLQALTKITGQDLAGFHENFLSYWVKKQLAIPTISQKITRVCPYCLKEVKYHRYSWSLIYNMTCPKHGNYLVWGCPDCLKHFTLEDVFEGRCTYCQKVHSSIKSMSARISVNFPAELSHWNSSIYWNSFVDIDTFCELLRRLMYLLHRYFPNEFGFDLSNAEQKTLALFGYVRESQHQAELFKKSMSLLN
ncbi:TniQ family protein [Paenibacillus sp. A3]|uniref:TniQ family protein n=1 Tax=Paenibacillus sp. A3 TaxID=1337054 RepID=UPI0009EBABBD|nr:TniQ family protein [Paenibacillus sp. A3]